MSARRSTASRPSDGQRSAVEIDEKLALHPTYLASRGDPQQFLDQLRGKMDEASQQSPELGEHGWLRTQRRYGVTETTAEQPEAAQTPG